MFEVIYAAVGCLPDSDMSEFVGTLEQCEMFVRTYSADYVRPDVDHDLYCLEIVEIDGDDFVMAGSDRDYFDF